MINQPNKFYVYYLIDPNSSRPFYVGKGYGNRMYDHVKSVKRNKIPNRNKHLFYKIQKIFRSNQHVIHKKILENVDEHTAFLIESQEIKRIGRSDLKLGTLCNLTDGGEGGVGHVCNEQVKKHMSLLHSGTNNPMYGKKHTPDSILKISVASKNQISPMKGKTHSKEVKIKLSKINRGRTFSDEHKQNLSSSHKKPIYQFTKDMILLQMWNSISDAAQSLNIDNSSIVKCARKKIPSSGGYKWVYA